MRTLNYSNITCPVSMEVIAHCDCQNCVIARMDSEFEQWRSERGLRLAVRVAGAGAAMLIVAVIVWAVQR